MFGASQFFQRLNTNRANEMGFDAAVLGLDYNNPFTPQSVDWKQWEWGWTEGLDVLEEQASAPTYPFSNEYGDYEL